MPAQIDRALVGRRARRCLRTYDQQATAQTIMAERLLGELAANGPAAYPHVLEIGHGTGVLTRRFLERFEAEQVDLNDLVPDYQAVLDPLVRAYPRTTFRFLGGDCEAMARVPAPLDLVISNATLHWLTDFAGMIGRLCEALRPGGRLAFSTFGPDNLQEMRTAGGVSLAYLTADEVTSILRRYCEVSVCVEEHLVVRFASPVAVLRHLRETGVNTLQAERWGRAKLRAFCDAYQNTHGQDGTLPLTYHALIFIAEKRNGGHLHHGH